MFFDLRNRFPMLFLPQNVHGMSYGHTHIWPWENIVFFTSFSLYFVSEICIMIHHTHTTDWDMFFDLMNPLTVLFLFRNNNCWVMATTIFNYGRGKFFEKLHFSGFHHDVCLRVLFLIRPSIANVDFYCKIFMKYAVTPIKNTWPWENVIWWPSQYSSLG